jgi:hypothetical protein
MTSRHILSAVAVVAVVTAFASGTLLAADSPNSNRNAAPATTLKSKPSETTPCDCSNCSAAHCQGPKIETMRKNLEGSGPKD